MSSPPRILEPVVFGTTFESLLIRALGDRLRPDAVAELKALKLDLSRPLEVAYPLETWARTLEIAARTVYPKLPSEEAFFRLGKGFMHGLLRTVMGKALVAYSKVVGPYRMLARMTSNFRTSNNYMESTLTRLPGGTIEMNTRVVPELLPKVLGRYNPSPHYMRGLLTGCVEAMDVRDVRVDLLASDPERAAATFRIHFSS